ncbi:tryptophan synthase subunit alpha [Geobacillus stearothermophilus]|uniref:Tryptophan synthase alpha chain n=5 Tax=Geobacillus stearothermophilus TaxID=1422 RepID=TRPA_GEOSE|nr:tryptophan synthase subunit alpha [Geobacillus stearothermophilus]P19867.1 RecName: Full=Tryptophan synthase alpha chain [Geobacillus stearothermophilus]MED3778279.1 tryptophan synthase subunit alpha [Geobacillus stearothermophilus]MED4333293.1 tryptophan synthase subunit alpha [Geobacillus stearothermophilus]MED4832964.1 tryptophan synthase subunit alpha [Geobacillus stearothermophilus]MED4962546.1 tryptophan synthase subunit alpha [Geobacillus stearothermophilus]BAA00428.1 tryptophan syn
MLLLSVNPPLFIPFIVAGDPSPEVTVDLALALEEAGADLLELGVPYSDPLADGPTIQRAAARALAGNMTLPKAIHLVAEMRKKGVTIPIILFTYYNPVLQLGEESFFALARENGANGVLIPDLPFEESGPLRELGERFDLPLISLVAPTSKQRIERIASVAQGFLYCVSSLGVTGMRETLPESLGDFVSEVKRHSRVPVAVGFGISTPEQVAMLKEVCDGVVIGSALVQKVEQLGERLLAPEEKEAAIAEFAAYARSLAAPLHAPCSLR